MPLPGLIDALKAHDAKVTRTDDTNVPSDKCFRASEKQGKSFKGPLFYEWRLDT